MAEFYVPIDVETTGLKPWEGHLLLEVAAFVVIPRTPFPPLDEPFQAVIKHDPEHARSLAIPYVQEMHDRTGLWDRLEDGQPIEEVDQALLEYLQKHMEPKEGYLFGNSIRLDANFIEFYLPKVSEFLHYRLIDVTTLGIYSRIEFDVPQFEKRGTHEALSDIEDSIDEIRFISREIVRACQ